VEPIQISSRVVIPTRALRWEAVRSAGPGGQNVNKVASKVRLRVNLELIMGMSAAARARLLRLAGRRLDESGQLVVTSQRTRDQGRNLEDACAKVRALVTEALHVPRARRPTHPSARSVERRLTTKRRRADAKRARRSPLTED
jgi:ribosome-associated protein